MKKTAFTGIAISLLMLGIFFPASVYAQSKAAGTAVSIPIVNKDVKDGSIISSTSKGYQLSTVDYDSNLYGVYTEFPAVYLQHTDDSQAKPVTISGKAEVLVSSVNGDIKKNDFITTSTIPGVGQRADRNGMIIGTALQDYSSSDQKATGKILVAVNPHFNSSLGDAGTNLLEAFNNLSNPGILSQLTTLRYLIAALVVILAFGIGFMYFGRIAARGVEALGRNPLASRMIQINIVLSLLVMILTMIFGLGIAYMILVL